MKFKDGDLVRIVEHGDEFIYEFETSIKVRHEGMTFYFRDDSHNINFFNLENINGNKYNGFNLTTKLELAIDYKPFKLELP